jgi:formylglycine-generating enzyme
MRWLPGPESLRRGSALLACMALCLETASAANTLEQGSRSGMVRINGGEFWMGDALFDDAQPVHRVRVHDFWIAATEVTNAEFKLFVAASGYRTVAERPLDPQEFPGVASEQRVPSSAVFAAPVTAVSLDDPVLWWRMVPGASWHHPEGPASSIKARMDHPVVHIAYEDAQAYAQWAGMRLPTEAEWEYAARGGLDRKPFAWGDEFRPHGRFMANTYQGQFPQHNTASDGFSATSPVKAFPPNRFALYGMAGNAWEWVADWYRPDYYRSLASSGPLSVDPQGPPSGAGTEESGGPRRVQKGGSFLCTDEYCGRYRPGARGQGEPASSGNHIGFRLAADCGPGEMSCAPH